MSDTGAAADLRTSLLDKGSQLQMDAEHYGFAQALPSAALQ